MRRLLQFALLALTSLLILPLSARANEAVNGWCQDGAIPVITSGLTSTTLVQGSFPQCTVTVYIHGTMNLATLYSDNNSPPTPLSNPFTADTNGQWLFYSAVGRYDIVLSNGGIPTPITLSDVVLFDLTDPTFNTVTVTGLATFLGGITGTGSLGAFTAGPGILAANNAWTGNETHSGTEGFSGVPSFTGGGNTGTLGLGPTALSANNSWSGNESHSGTEAFTGPFSATGGTLSGTWGLSGIWTLAGTYAITGTPTFTGGGNTGTLSLGSTALGANNAWSGNESHAGTESFSGPLNSTDLAAGNVANKPPAGGGYWYVASGGSDSNDGLSQGSSFATPQKCNTAAIAAGGGTCDARMLFNYTTTTEIDAGNITGTFVTLLLPPYGNWHTTGTIAGNVLKVYQNSSAIGTNSGLGSLFGIHAASGSNVTDVCGTPNESPRGYVKITGFGCFADTGSTVTNTCEWQSLVDLSQVDITCSNHSGGVGLYEHNNCCHASIKGASNSVDAAGSIPCVFGSSSDSDNSIDIVASCTLAGTGEPNVEIIQDGGSLDHISLYTEEGSGDTTTPNVKVTCPIGASTSPDFIDNFEEGAAVVSETRFMVDVAANCSMDLNNISTGGITGNAVDDHTTGRTIVLAPGGVLKHYETNNGARPSPIWTSILGSGGIKATLSGCSFSTQLGGEWAGSFESGTSGTCTVTISPGYTAPTGWLCSTHDLTTPADTIPQTAYTTTGCTVSGTTVSGDLITFEAVAF